MKMKQPAVAVAVFLGVMTGWSASADEAKPAPAKSEKENKQAAARKSMTEAAVSAESSRRKARAALQTATDSSLEDFKKGACSLERMILVQRMSIEMDIDRPLAAESVPSVYNRHLKIAGEISSQAKARYEAGSGTKQDFDFAEAHRLTLEYLRQKAKSDLVRLRAGSR